MAEKTKAKAKSNKGIVIVIIAIIVIVAIGFGIYKLVGGATKEDNSWQEATNVEDIVINESDSEEVKVEKLQSKIDLLTTEITEVENQLNTELEKMNSLCQEYIAVMSANHMELPVVDDNAQ